MASSATQKLAEKLYSAWFVGYYGSKAKATPFSSLPESIQEVWYSVAEEASKTGTVKVPRTVQPKKPVVTETVTPENG